MFNRNKSSEETAEATPAPAKPARGTPGEPPIAKPRRPDIPGFDRARGAQSAGQEPEGSKLTVGRDIHLKGEITSCDVLMVEGTVEASMNSRHIGIAESGVFEGKCEIDTADISGRFDGNLEARQRLIVRSTGRVTGTIRYGEIQIEAGGVIAGDVQVAGKAPAKSEPQIVQATSAAE
jgi:cytoskeletal protein CcmA (bactofilin family)